MSEPGPLIEVRPAPMLDRDANENRLAYRTRAADVTVCLYYYPGVTKQQGKSY